jgi:hypothetical protein
VKEKIKKIADRKRALSRVFRDEEDSDLLKLELLKRNSIYIKFFLKYRYKMAAAYAGRLADDEEVWDTLAYFLRRTKASFRNRYAISPPTCYSHHR